MMTSEIFLSVSFSLFILNKQRPSIDAKNQYYFSELLGNVQQEKIKGEWMILVCLLSLWTIEIRNDN